MSTLKPSSLTIETIDAMLELFENCFKKVRSLILDNAGKTEHTNKSDGSPVTEIDVAIESMVTKEITDKFPGTAVYGEESGYADDLPSICWLIDPIDGTESFINNLPNFTCMAVLIVNNGAEACIIYNPTTNDVYTAKRGLGAFKNGIRLKLGELPLPSVAYCKDFNIEALNQLTKPLNIDCRVAPSGAGYGFASVAEGSIAARFQLHSRGYAHDYAPGALLVKEAGGSIVVLNKTPHEYNLRSFVACHPQLEKQLLDHLDAVKTLETIKT